MHDGWSILNVCNGGSMWQELKKLGLPKEEFRFSKLSEELVLNPADPVENVRIFPNETIDHTLLIS